MPVNFILDLIGLICHINTAVGVAGTHFCLRTLQSWEEFGVDESGFGIFQFDSNVSGEAEVGILVYCTGDETWDVRDGPENVGEGIGEGGGGLDSRKVNFANVIAESRVEVYGTQDTNILLTTR